MTRFVIDASVAADWFIPETHAQAAARVLRGTNGLLAPDLIWAEVGNVFWKKWRRGERVQEHRLRGSPALGRGLTIGTKKFLWAQDPSATLVS